MNNKKTIHSKIAVIGGDMRQTAIADALISKGADVASWGLPHKTCVSDWRAAVCHADALILPLPVTKDGIHVNAPLHEEDAPPLDDIISAAGRTSVILGGKIPSIVKKYAAEHGVALTDYFDHEELQIKNTLPTAEGAVEIAMHELPITLMGATVAVIGYGRVAKTLARTLIALKAHVTCAARSDTDLAWAEVDGCAPVRLESFLDVPRSPDVIFNTVPHMIIKRSTLEKLPSGTLIIDLATAPGGVEREAADELGIKTILASSLPGKMSPVTAGKIISSTVTAILRREGVSI